MAQGPLDAVLALAALPAAAIPTRASEVAVMSLYDWLAVGRAGAATPLAVILRGYVLDEGGRPVAGLFGGGRAPARAAALANGAISHALDFDDTHFAHIGHPSVAILPAALAVGEERDATARAVVDAFLIGAEASVRFGLHLGRGHYDRGFHQTATAGAVGAAVAAGRLYGVDPAGMARALGLVASRASGIRAQFGSMGKPYNAGVAAANGVEAAGLAARGFTAAGDGLFGPHGFVATHADAPDVSAAWADPPPARFRFEEVKYKLHACCHGAHAMIEALRSVAPVGLAPDAVERVELRVSPRWLGVCDLKAPRTGLEVKFSFAWLAAMVLCGVDTARETTYRGALCSDPRLAALARRVVVAGDPAVPDTATFGALRLGDGREIALAHDLAAPAAPKALAAALRTKASALIGPAAADELWAAVEAVDRLSARDLGAVLAG